MILRRLLLPALLMAVALPAAAEEPDGRAVFEARCASCHAVAAGAPPGAGPNLAGVVGRRVGGDP
ncbi:MAG: c-type cytochrome, partial [Acetobacteraceae bacterium]|nr:c-type cytochrome [Acetobacteraceae bacterium]